MVTWRKSHRCPCKIRNLRHISCSTWGPVAGPRAACWERPGDEHESSIHLQSSHSLADALTLASSAQWLSPWLQSHAEWCSRWGEEVVNVYDSTLGPFLHPPLPPLRTHKSSLSLLWPRPPHYETDGTSRHKVMTSLAGTLAPIRRPKINK